MKNKIILAVFVLLLLLSFYKEPIGDTIDLLFGSTSDTHNIPDDYAGVSIDEEDEEEDDD